MSWSFSLLENVVDGERGDADDRNRSESGEWSSCDEKVAANDEGFTNGRKLLEGGNDEGLEKQCADSAADDDDNCLRLVLAGQ